MPKKGNTWVVKAGDNLEAIAAQLYGSQKYANVLSSFNEGVLTLRPGQVLRLPGQRALAARGGVVSAGYAAATGMSTNGVAPDGYNRQNAWANSWAKNNPNGSLQGFGYWLKDNGMKLQPGQVIGFDGSIVNQDGTIANAGGGGSTANWNQTPQIAVAASQDQAARVRATIAQAGRGTNRGEDPSRMVLQTTTGPGNVPQTPNRWEAIDAADVGPARPSQKSTISTYDMVRNRYLQEQAEITRNRKGDEPMGTQNPTAAEWRAQESARRRNEWLASTRNNDTWSVARAQQYAIESSKKQVDASTGVPITGPSVIGLTPNASTQASTASTTVPSRPVDFKSIVPKGPDDSAGFAAFGQAAKDYAVSNNDTALMDALTELATVSAARDAGDMSATLTPSAFLKIASTYGAGPSLGSVPKGAEYFDFMLRSLIGQASTQVTSAEIIGNMQGGALTTIASSNQASSIGGGGALISSVGYGPSTQQASNTRFGVGPNVNTRFNL